jgi:hypothetical protein
VNSVAPAARATGNEAGTAIARATPTPRIGNEDVLSDPTFPWNPRCLRPIQVPQKIVHVQSKIIFAALSSTYKIRPAKTIDRACYSEIR